MYPQLYQAIEEAVTAGIPTRYIAYGLVQAGWPPKAVQEAIDSWLMAHGRLQKTTDYKHWLKKYYKQAFPAVILMVVLNTIASGIALLRPWPTKILADSAFGDIPPPALLSSFASDKPKLILIVSGLTLIIYLLGQFFGVIKDYLLLKIGYWLNRNIKEESFRHILHLPLYHQERLAKGDYIYRQNVVTSSLSDLVLSSTSSIAESAIMVTGVLIIMFQLNIRLTLISIILVPFLFLVIKLLGPKLGKVGRELAQLASKISSHITESVDNAETVQAFTLEERQVTQLNSLWEQNYQLARRGLAWGKLFSFTNGLLIILGSSAVVYYGGTSALKGEMTLGQLLIFITYMNYLLGPIQEIAEQITSRRQKMIDVHRVYEVLSDHEGVETLRRDKHFPRAKGQIELQHVSYAYKDNLVFNDVSITIPSGQKVGIIGPSGAGKSTILKLLPLFIEPMAGRVLLDGVDIQTVSLHDLRRNIAWISQSPQLFSKSITDNMTDGDVFRSMTPQELVWAAKAANVEEFANRLPLKYDTPAGEQGTSLSGGQRQRISIARALLKNAPVICMDEPTSALDDRSEQFIRESIGTLIHGKTVILVTHRMSLLNLMDVVYVLEGGQLRDVRIYGGYEKYMHYLQAHEQM